MRGTFEKIRSAALLAGSLLVASAMPSVAHNDNPLRDFYSPSKTSDFREEYGTYNTVNVDLPYGPDANQTYDVYRPDHPASAPIIMMVHGGGWTSGDKQDDDVAAAKAAWWTARGYIFVSVNYRLLSGDVEVMDQAFDVATSIVDVQKKAAEWGGNPDKIVLMGHGAGGHLVGLIAANPGYVTDQIQRPLKGAVILDSAALDVSSLMATSAGSDFVDVFGQDQTAWQDLSPRQVLSGAGLPVMIICSQNNSANSCGQAQAYRAAADAVNVSTQVLPVDLDTGEVSALLGQSQSYTESVDAFLDGIL